MGLGKSFSKAFRAVPLVKLVKAVAQGEPGDLKSVFSFDPETASNRAAKAKSVKIGIAQKIAAEALAVKEAEKQAIISDAVKQQEEKERRRTLFGGEAIGQTAERKSLLGL
jgi:hypothetical protein